MKILTIFIWILKILFPVFYLVSQFFPDLFTIKNQIVFVRNEEATAQGSNAKGGTSNIMCTPTSTKMQKHVRIMKKFALANFSLGFG